MMEDSRIIDLFFERSEKAIYELSKKYGKQCAKLSYSILNNHEDAEECVNDSYLGVWEKIPPKKPNPLLTFVLKIVRNISIDKLRYNTRDKRDSAYTVCIDELSRYPVCGETVESETELKLLTSLINEFLEKTDKTSRIIFVKRYWFMDSYEDISAFTGLSEGAVRTRLSRTRDGLFDFLEERSALNES